MTTLTPYCDTKLTEQFVEELNHKLPKLRSLSGELFYTLKKGKRFDKIICNKQHRGETSTQYVYCFVEKQTGEVIKAENWSSPSKNKHGETPQKYFLSTPEQFAIVVHNADEYGAFLYNSYTPVKP